MSISVYGNKLTAKQAIFVQHYVKLKNASKVAAKMGMTHYQIGKYLATAKVRKEIRRRLQNELDAVQADPDAIIAEIARDAFIDVGDYFNAQGDLHNIHDMPEHVRKNIATIKIRRERSREDDKTMYAEVIEIKRVDKMAALDKLAKFHTLLSDRVVVEDGPALTAMGTRQRHIEHLHRQRLEAEAKKDGGPGLGAIEEDPIEGDYTEDS